MPDPGEPPTHPLWCDRRRCSVGVQPMTAAGEHRGHVTPVLRPDGSMIATARLESRDGPPRVVLGQYRLTADEADAVADALREVADALRGLR